MSNPDLDPATAAGDLAALIQPSSDAWVNCVVASFDEFLPDHAANERKAHAMAMSLVAHYPDQEALVTEMIDLALEELTHFREVVRLMQSRGIIMPPDEKDPYVNQLRGHIRKDPEVYLLDRLLCGAIIEARGEERFRRLGEALTDSDLSAFYQALARADRILLLGREPDFCIRFAETPFVDGDCRVDYCQGGRPVLLTGGNYLEGVGGRISPDDETAERTRHQTSRVNCGCAWTRIGGDL